MQNKWFDEGRSTEELLEDGVNQIWIKRDDLIHPIVSGNKWRKLKYLIAHCQENNIYQIITYGGAYSNHSIATACVCSLYNIKCSIIIRGEKPAIDNHYTLLLKAFEAELTYVSRELYKHKEDALKLLHCNEQETLVLPEGGEHPLSEQGCAELINGLNNQYDAIFVASGTGTTALALLKALNAQSSACHLYIVPVLKNEEEIQKKLVGCFNYTVVKNAHLGGYAKTNPQVFKTINIFLMQHGVMLDPVYTAKCYMAMQQKIAESEMQNQKILLIHTGGQLGLFSNEMLKKWASEE